MKLKKSQQGLSLIEVLISLSITITITGLLTNFLFNFNKTSIAETKRTELASELRTANLRLQKEIESASKVLTSFTDTYTGITYQTNKDTLVLARPVFNKNTYEALTYKSPVNSDGSNSVEIESYDKVIIKYNRSTTSLKEAKLTFTLIPATKGVTSDFFKSPYIKSQTLAHNISNYTKDDKSTPTVPFKFYDNKNALIESAPYNKATLIAVDLYARQTYGDRPLRDSLFTKIALRNFVSNKGG